MKERRTTTFPGIAKELLGLYSTLLGLQDLAMVETHNNLIGRRLRLLSQIVRGEITQESLSLEKAIRFYEALLDGIALQYATGASRGVFDCLEIGNPNLLGKQKVRRVDLKVGNEFLADWHFARLVQAAASAQGFRIKDLRYDSRFKNKQVCDFALKSSNSSVELLECKRVHPEKLPKKNQPTMAVEKILSRLTKAINQLENSACVLKASHTCKHVLFDVSAYAAIKGRAVKMKTDSLFVVGFRLEEIDKIHQLLVISQDKLSPILDKITICWREVIFIDGRPTAIIQNVNTHNLKPKIDGLLKYEGWTVEGYPKKSSKYAEFRVSNTARSLAWIKTTYNNLSSPETFYTIAPAE